MRNAFNRFVKTLDFLLIIICVAFPCVWPANRPLTRDRTKGFVGKKRANTKANQRHQRRQAWNKNKILTRSKPNRVKLLQCARRTTRLPLGGSKPDRAARQKPQTRGKTTTKRAKTNFPDGLFAFFSGKSNKALQRIASPIVCRPRTSHGKPDTPGCTPSNPLPPVALSCCSRRFDTTQALRTILEVPIVSAVVDLVGIRCFDGLDDDCLKAFLD